MINVTIETMIIKNERDIEALKKQIESMNSIIKDMNTVIVSMSAKTKPNKSISKSERKYREFFEKQLNLEFHGIHFKDGLINKQL